MNKRIIFTGGPSCGKTELIKEIKKRGFPCIHEVAREVIRERTYVPQTEPFQLEIFRRQIVLEEERMGFFDRSALDGVVYSEKYLGFVPKEIIRFDYTGRYDHVFILNRLPFKSDGERVERDDNEAEDVHRRIIQVYLRQGFVPTHLPLFPGKLQESVSKRADFVLNYLRKEGF
jgi:predicted ATPase